MATKVEWAERVQRWEQSGLSAEKFARREGYKPKQLYWWRWKTALGVARDYFAQASVSNSSSRSSTTATYR
ncbi:IS66 family insertion sequence element accessory protein TnpA [Sorangium sp. So ce145]|uniref:IS66 family insertion sequence element accessory protein TnpA n=1 Tax=Sorangium sp. So ce145 TaxID=3133285 RepID=UPI003F6300B9